MTRCKSKVGSIGCCHGEGADDNVIHAGELRFGSLDTDSGTYGRWHHLKCWRVPSAVWTGFPPPRPPNSLTEEQKGDDLAAAFAAAIVAMEQLVFCGFSDLSEEQKVRSEPRVCLLTDIVWAAAAYRMNGTLVLMFYD